MYTKKLHKVLTLYTYSPDHFHCVFYPSNSLVGFLTRSRTVFDEVCERYMYQICWRSKEKYKYHTRALSFRIICGGQLFPPIPLRELSILYIASRPLPSLRAAEQPLARAAGTVRHGRRYGPPITVQNIAPRIPLL
jgi:hypothetical protein